MLLKQQFRTRQKGWKTMGPRVTVLFNYCFEYQTILSFRKKIPKGILFLLRAHLSHFHFLLPNLTRLLKIYSLLLPLFFLIPLAFLLNIHSTFNPSLLFTNIILLHVFILWNSIWFLICMALELFSAFKF